MSNRFLALAFSCSLLLVPITAQAQGGPTANCELSFADDAERVYRAQEILKVNAANWTSVINFWSIDAIYQESVITNYSRAEMSEYLSAIFSWSSDMELVIGDEIYGYDPADPVSGDFIYAATNVWSGTWDGFSPYVQTGMSIVKFRHDEGCAYYQRDYFTEGDTWIRIPEVTELVSTFREEYLRIIGYTDKCFDDDGDGYSKYKTTGCTYPSTVRDCNDYDENINPGVEEIPSNGIDDNCNTLIDEVPLPCSTFPVKIERTGQILPFFALFVLPLGYAIVLRRRFSKKRHGFC